MPAGRDHRAQSATPCRTSGLPGHAAAGEHGVACRIPDVARRIPDHGPWALTGAAAARIGAGNPQKAERSGHGCPSAGLAPAEAADSFPSGPGFLFRNSHAEPGPYAHAEVCEKGSSSGCGTTIRAASMMFVLTDLFGNELRCVDMQCRLARGRNDIMVLHLC